jgi:hypothetical protein
LILIEIVHQCLEYLLVLEEVLENPELADFEYVDTLASRFSIKKC